MTLLLTLVILAKRTVFCAVLSSCPDVPRRVQVIKPRFGYMEKGT